MQPDNALDGGLRRILRHRTAGALTDDERAVLRPLFTEIRVLPAGRIAVRQGEPVHVSTLLLEGMMTRHVDAPDGRRHLVGVHVPGDFVDLHAYPLKSLDHDVGALTVATIAVMPHAAMEHVQQTRHELTRKLWFQTLLDAAMHRQWVYRLSSLTAIARVAHFLCETNARLLAIGLSDGRSFTLPMTQADIGEVCGLTNVHVNRVLRELREQALCSMRASQVEIHDLAGLAHAGRFDAQYLYLDAAARARALALPDPTP